MRQEREVQIWALKDYKKRQDCYRDVVLWKRKKRGEGFKVSDSIEENGQVLVFTEGKVKQ